MPNIKPQIIVIGSSNTDMIVQLDKIPNPGETLLGGKFVTAPGGKGANQAVAAARAGGDVVFIARIGNDLFGNETLPRLEAEKIDVTHIIRDPSEPSGVALIFVSKAGENSIGVAPGANSCLSPSDVQKAVESFSQAAYLLIQLETPLNTVIAAVNLATSHQIPVILNPAPATQLPSSLLQNISIITPNETEAEFLTGVKVADVASAEKAAIALLQQGVSTVIITMGARGAFVANDQDSFMVPSLQICAKDSTAAGDVFNGALAVALGEEMSIRDAVSFACAAAAVSVTRMGAQTSIPTRNEIEHQFKSSRSVSKSG